MYICKLVPKGGGKSTYLTQRSWKEKKGGNSAGKILILPPSFLYFSLFSHYPKEKVEGKEKEVRGGGE